MKKNFKVGQSNELIISDKVYDLHNLYDFSGLLLNSKDKALQLFFDPNFDYGKGLSAISVRFEIIKHLEFSSNFFSNQVSGIDEIGYKNSQDRDDEYLITQSLSTDEDHLFFRMDNGEFIRVYCENVILVDN